MLNNIVAFNTVFLPTDNSIFTEMASFEVNIFFLYMMILVLICLNFLPTFLLKRCFYFSIFVLSLRKQFVYSSSIFVFLGGVL